MKAVNTFLPWESNVVKCRATCRCCKNCVWKCLWEVLFSENIKNDDNIVYLYCDFGVNQYLLLWKAALCCMCFLSTHPPDLTSSLQTSPLDTASHKISNRATGSASRRGPELGIGTTLLHYRFVCRLPLVRISAGVLAAVWLSCSFSQSLQVNIGITSLATSVSFAA
jgi:hypothetical protein